MMTTVMPVAGLWALGEKPTGNFAVATPDDTRRCLSSIRRSGECEAAVRRGVKPKVSNASTPSGPIPWSAAVMSNGDDADQIALQPVNQGIRKTVEGQSPRVAGASVTQLGKTVQEAKRSIKFIGEFIRCDERAFACVPIDDGIGVGLRLVAKTDPHRLWRH